MTSWLFTFFASQSIMHFPQRYIFSIQPHTSTDERHSYDYFYFIFSRFSFTERYTGNDSVIFIFHFQFKLQPFWPLKLFRVFSALHQRKISDQICGQFFFLPRLFSPWSGKSRGRKRPRKKPRHHRSALVRGTIKKKHKSCPRKKNCDPSHDQKTGSALNADSWFAL